MGGLVVARVHAWLSFEADGRTHQAAAVSWFLRQQDIPEPSTGMWTVLPEYEDEDETQLRYAVIGTDCIVHACGARLLTDTRCA
ncbi:hypothetical protein BDV98DRAFT_572242 [Pterulicium gracile]|uniref:Uncharacterized protein n=1 Tax=Pterulicium gracile TaxID=1884261 RepID=A0A5C3QKB7_9AGAR|nr:hypothetical protein BDV98DRAFT_572242 [Pterula gracilis]